MKLLSLIAFCFFAFGSLAQGTNYKKTIEITDGENPVVSIKTESNGKVTEEYLEGDAAKQYIENDLGGSDKIIDLEITQADLQAFDQDLQMLLKNIEKRVIELNETPMDTTVQRINKRIDRTSKCIKKEICGAI